MVVLRDGGKAAEVHLPGDAVHYPVHCPADAFTAVVLVDKPAHEAFPVCKEPQKEVSDKIVFIECAHHEECAVFQLAFQGVFVKPVRVEVPEVFFRLGGNQVMQ